MSDYCVVVAQGARARFFTLEPAEIPELQSGPRLVERTTLSNPEHQAHFDAIWEDTRGGRNRGADAGVSHGYDEHRERHDAETERRFARDIARNLRRLALGNGSQRVVVCAEKRMLGFLRPTLAGAFNGEVELREVPKDYTKLPARKVHDRLAAEGHIPRRRRPRR